ncbi:hypothetical protein Scep_025597 [Stephania cephalantha]|uniref:UBR-type domain-containing protein n=1 Tax=Stephania cephalantha TaxID=152367 RepID=A0AAP0EP45_9MAGN
MADAFEDEEAEQTVSIQEYLKSVEEQELEADLVLGGDEGKECTYEKGYMKRQAIFSCLTCMPDGNAGVCTGCSLSCHDGHEIVELWTKRNFRCDCGNSRFGEFYCKLLANKDPENIRNSYNQNFKGSYCTCGRPYPDQEAEEQVEMIQCCICEDWFHENHLGLESPDEIPRDEEGEPIYEDFICQSCANLCSFLTLYPPFILVTAKQCDASVNGDTKESMSAGASAVNVNGYAKESMSAGASSVNGYAKESMSAGASSVNGYAKESMSAGASSVNGDVKGSMSAGASSVNGDAKESMSADASSVSENGKKVGQNSEDNMDLNGSLSIISPIPKCKLGVDLQGAHLDLVKKPFFLSKSWRDLLCTCESCGDFYAKKGVGFLIDREDSIIEYEKIAQQKRQEKLQQEVGEELNFLNKLGHVEKIEILSGIADMKNELQSFLESVDPSKPVTSADVRQVFENLAKKRQRLV